MNHFVFTCYLFTSFSYFICNLNETVAVEVPERQHGVWFHIVFNFLGFSYNNPITVYNDGVQVTDATKIRYQNVQKLTETDRRIVLGRGPFDFYVTQHVDELRYHNHALTEEEITQLVQEPVLN